MEYITGTLSELGKAIALARAAKLNKAMPLTIKSRWLERRRRKAAQARLGEITEHADETGIVVAGKDSDGHGYVLADASGRYAPAEWAKAAIAAYRAHGADRIVAEVNNGGDMVEATLRIVDPSVAYSAVHAARGKIARAEPVAALYEQGRVHHLGAFPALEDQMCGFVHDFDRAAAGYSPDRVDALVWALTELLVQPLAGQGIFEAYRRLAQQGHDQQEHEAP
jgi:phage terminase large subunit-like protein